MLLYRFAKAQFLPIISFEYFKFEEKNALLGLGGIKPTTNRMVVLLGSLMCGALTTELLVF